LKNWGVKMTDMSLAAQVSSLISFIKQERPNIVNELEKYAEVRIDADNFNGWYYGQEQKVLDVMNKRYPKYLFEHVTVYGGNASDLYISNRELKRQEDKRRESELINKLTHTYMELWQKLNKDYGVQTSSTFHHNPSAILTDSEFKEQLAFYKAMCEIIRKNNGVDDKNNI